MGGFGSGQRYGVECKDTTKDHRCMDIKDFKNILNTTIDGTVDFDGHTMKFILCPDSLTLEYVYTLGKNKPVPVTTVIPIDKTPCNYGGFRHWFRCPDCHKRVGSLYFVRIAFTCRVCAKLNYRCQHEMKEDRLYRKARKIRQKLETKWFTGDDIGNLSIHPWFKPKNMHQSTFNKLNYLQNNLVLNSMIISCKKMGMLIDDIL